MLMKERGGNSKHIVISVVSDVATDQRVLRTARTLRDRGFRVTIVGRELNESLPIHIDEVRIVRFKLFINNGPLFYASFNIRLFIFLLFCKCDILLANDLDTLFANSIASRLRSKVLIYDSHEYFTGVPEIQNRILVKKAWEWIELACIKVPSVMYTVNRSIAQLYSNKYNINVQVIRNVPDVPKGVQPLTGDEKMQKRKELGLPIDKNVLVIQGAGINIDRGAEEALLSLKYLEGSVLMVIGGGDVMDSLLKIQAEYNLQDKVLFFDKMPYSSLLEFTSAADIGLTLDKDTNINYKYSLPNKLFDYINAGIPVLSSNLIEIKQIIDKYDIGMITDSHEPNKIANTINKMLLSPNRVKNWPNNLKKAAQELNWDTEKQKLISIFESLEK